MNKKLPSSIESYLNKRADGKRKIYRELDEKFQVVVVIPVIQEFQNILPLLDSLAKCSEESKEKTLILFCVNNSPLSPDKVKVDNIKTIDLLKDLLKKNSYKLNINFIDAASEGNELPGKDAGVGLARKIGADIALKYFNYKQQQNIIIYLDGDCTVEPSYLESIINEYDKNKFDAAVIDYEHPLDNEAIVAYEIFLRYYVLGLQFAGSRYAYHSIGSTITLTPETYVKVGGMNKRKAGEDFYLLEKISKLTNIGSIKSTKVYPSARRSWRVPFGTGKSIIKFYDEEKDMYQLYNPEIFVVLKKWITLLYESDNVEFIVNNARMINEHLHSFLVEQNFHGAMSRIIKNSTSQEQIKKQKDFWFDAFKTLKLIHFLRDKELSNQFMYTALNRILNFCEINNHPNWNSSSLPPLETQIEYLNVLRNN